MRRVLVPLTVSGNRPPLGTRLHELAGATMGTTWSARVMLAPGAGSGSIVAEQLQLQLDEVVAQMSHWLPNSDLSRYNSAAAGSWHRLPEAFTQVLGYALWTASVSGGAYDPCAGALVNLWGFGAQRRYDQADFYAPSDQAVRAVMARREREQVQFDAVNRRLLQPGATQLDLSSVAKGFAVDQLARWLDAQGLHHYLVEVGGELRGAGVKPDGEPWWVALESVPDLPCEEETVVALHGLAVATSGDYRRHFQHGRWRASHTLDPRTGYPIRNGVASVTVIHRECMAADALSTALSVLGPEHGLAFAERHHLAARFLVRKPGALHEITSSAFRAMLQ
jgi:thiamine biosynthesis lipoprotein